MGNLVSLLPESWEPMTDTYVEVKCTRWRDMAMLANFEQWKEMHRSWTVDNQDTRDDSKFRLFWLDWRNRTRTEMLEDLLVLTCQDI